MKKYLLSLTTLAILLCEACFTGGGMAFANNAVGDSWNDGNFTYKVLVIAPSTSSPGKVSVKAKDGASISGALSLSSQVSHKFTLFGSTYNYDVTEIAANGFQNKTGITSLSIAGSVVTIGNYAFDGCTNISGTVSIPAATQTVGNYAFRNCSSITEFNYSYYTSGDYTNKRRLTSVGQYAYDGCSNASFVGIWSDKTAYLTSIGNYAFRGCTSMTSVSVPASVTSIGTSAFEGCTSLTTITFNGTGVTSWPASMCKGCTSLSKIGTGSVTAGRVAVYNAVTSIGSSAFEGCTSISSVVFSGTNVTTLAASVFKGCTSLTQMGTSAGYFTIPNSITTINESAFENCTGITKLTIGEGVTTLNSAAFTGCSNITTVTWNAKTCNSSYSSSANPFSASKDKITSFTFGNKVEKIPTFLCYQLTEITSVTIPQSVTFAGGGAFGGCSKLTNVVWNAANCANFTRSYSSGIPTYSSPFCQGAASGTLIKASNLTTITFGSNVTNVPADMCIECKNLKVVTWEAGSATIGSSAFSGCTALKSVIWNKTNCANFASASATPFYSIRTQIESFTFKNSVMLIPDYLCDGMTNLKQVSLPSTVTTVGANAFNGCTGIEVFACAKTTAPTAAASSFTDVPCCLTVPADSWDSYKDATGWSHFNNASCSNAPSDIVRGTCGAQGKNLIWELNLTSGEMTISGTGEMADYTTSVTAPWWAYKNYLKSVTVEEGATSIGKYAFYQCDKIESVFIPKSLIAIKYEAFWYCYALSEVTFAENSELTTIGNFAFERCTTLTHITIPEEVQTFDGASAFSYCDALTSVTWNARNCPDFSSSTTGPFNSKNTNIQSFEFGPAVEHIPSYLCSGMSNAAFTSITIPENVTSIGANAFYGCSSLTDVTWNAVHCGDFSTASVAPFYEHRANIQSVEFGEAVEYIPARLCYGLNNASFTSVTIPASVTTIATSAFENCTGLTSVNMRGADNLDTIAYSAFDGCSNVAGEIYIPASVTSVSGYIFHDFSKVTSMYVMPTSVPTGATSTSFANMVKTIPVYFASTDYTTANYWKDFTNYTCSGYCGAEEGGLNLTWTYTNSNKTLTISGTGAMADYNTTDNRAPWYDLRSELTKLVIEEGVTTIGANAFYAPYSFAEISFPASLEESKTASFATINGPTRVNYAGTLAQWCDVKLGALSSTPMNYGTPSFYANGTQILGTVTVPEGVDTIKNYTLINLGITNLYLPSTLEYIGSSAVDKNDATLTNVYYAGSAADWCGVGVASNTSHPLYEGKDNNPQLYCNGSKPTSLVVPAGVTTLNDYHFYNCQELTSVTISADITAIGANTFTNCSKLATIVWNATKCQNFSGTSYAPFYNVRSQITSITFGSSVKRIPGYLCYGMNNASLKSISIPNSVDTIGNYAFKACSKLEEINFGAESSLTSLGSNAFENDSSLTNVVLPSKLREIKSSTFNSCNKLESITIPDSVKQMATSSTTTIFNGCTALRTINWNAVSCAGFNMACNGPNSCSYFTPFKNVTSQITTFNVGANVEVLPRHLCYGMSELISVALPEGLETIGDRVFYGCTGLTSITIPSTVTSIGDDVFYNCTSLASVTSQASTPQTIEASTFASLPESKKLYVHHSVSAKAAYRAASGWSSFTEANTFPKIVQFDLNGQTDDAIDPQFFDNITSKASAPSDPADVNYHSFSGWYENPEGTGSEFAFSTTNITEDKTLYAKWTIYNYQVTFNMQGHGDAIDAQSVNYNGLVSQPSAPSEVGYTFGGWFKEPACSNAWDFSNDHITAATTLYAKWTINNYDVTFNMQGHGDAIDAQSVNYNGLVSQPSAPSETGYTFGGWYDNEECTGEAFDFSTEITADLTLFAKWTINSYDVTFDLQGHGDAIDAQSINYNGLVSQPSAPSADYYTFGGWYKEPACSNVWDFSEDRISEATTLYAKWTRADLTLNDNADNSDALTEYDDETTNVHLTRTIISASFNTLCLPFAMTAGQVETYFGAECDIEELTRASYADGDLKLFFTKRTAIEAGKPYLIKPQADVANPTIADVTIDSTARPIVFEGVTFTGTFSPTVLANSEDLLFLGASNTLYMSSGGTMKGMRGYFQLTTPQAQAAARRSARIVFHEEVATGIETVESQESKVESTKIMRDGQLLIIRDGKTYNAQGALIK